MSIREKLSPFAAILVLPLGAAASAFAFCLYQFSFGSFFVWAFIICLMHAYFIALPVYLLLPLKWKISRVTPIIIGFLIGAIPSAFFIYPATGGIWDGGKDFFYFVGSSGLLGSIGAIIAWVAWMYLKGYLPKPKSASQNQDKAL